MMLNYGLGLGAGRLDLISSEAYFAGSRCVRGLKEIKVVLVQ